MRIIFMGTPDFAVASLEALVGAGHDIMAVVTQPDRPRGRGRKVMPSPVKKTAQFLKIPVLQPSKLTGQDFLDRLKELEPEVIVVVAYGRLLPSVIFGLPKLGCINVHASLLPKYRGAAPVHWAVINGETETGVTTMYINEEMDAGDIILKKTVAINDDDNMGILHDRLAAAGAELLVNTLNRVADGSAPRLPQTGTPTYAPLLGSEDELIKWDRPARQIYNHVRGMNPWPGARTRLFGQVLKVWQAELLNDDDVSDEPGRVLSSGVAGIIVAAGRGRLALTEIQLQGARKLAAAVFLRGNPVPEGTVLG